MKEKWPARADRLPHSGCLLFQADPYVFVFKHPQSKKIAQIPEPRPPPPKEPHRIWKYYSALVNLAMVIR